MAQYDISTGNNNTLYANSGNYNYLAKDINGNFWLAYKTNSIDKIKRWNPSNNTTTQAINIGSSINDIKTDANGNLWIATTNGLFKIDPVATPVVTASSITDLSTIEITTATYQWFWSPDNSNAKISAGGNYQTISGATSHTYQADQTGYYIVDITEDGVTRSSDPIYVELATTGTIANISAIKILISPNPSNGTFTIEGDNVSEVILTDESGRRETHILKGGNQKVSTHLKGVLLVTIKTEKGVTNKKILINW